MVLLACVCTANWPLEIVPRLLSVQQKPRGVDSVVLNLYTLETKRGKPEGLPPRTGKAWKEEPGYLGKSGFQILSFTCSSKM